MLLEIVVSVITSVLCVFGIVVVLNRYENLLLVKKKGDDSKDSTEKVNDDDEEIKYLVCGITHEIMHDPVLLNDGHTYERSAVEQWFAAGHRTSPVTRQQVDTKLVPNLVIRGLIDDYRKRKGLSALPTRLPIERQQAQQQTQQQTQQQQAQQQTQQQQTQQQQAQQQAQQQSTTNTNAVNTTATNANQQRLLHQQQIQQILQRRQQQQQQQRPTQRATLQMAPETVARVAAAVSAIVSATPDRAAALGLSTNDTAGATRLALARSDILSGLADAARSVPRLEQHATMLSRIGEQQSTMLNRMQREQRRARQLRNNLVNPTNNNDPWPRLLQTLREDNLLGFQNILGELNGQIMNQFEEDESLAHYAARFDATECLEWLLNERPNFVPESKLDGASLAHIAAMHDARDCLALLVRFGKDLDNRALGVPHHLAALCHQIEQRPLCLSSTRPSHITCTAKPSNSRASIWRILFDNGADFTARDDMISTLIHCAATTADIHALNFALSKTPQLINALDKARATPLHRICDTKSILARNGAEQCVACLISYGADPNIFNLSGLAPLHIATANTNPHCAQTAAKLCEALCRTSDIQIDLKSVKAPFQTPLHIAVTNNKLDAVKVLLKYGASVLHTDAGLRTPLHIAAGSNKISVAIINELYAKYTSPPQAIDANGHTPLTAAAAADNTDSLRAMIALGLNHNSSDESALHYASQHNALRCAEILLDQGWPVNIRAQIDQCTPLHRCAGRGLVAMAQLLLSRGADPSLRAVSGATAIDFARVMKDPRMLALLTRQQQTNSQQSPNSIPNNLDEQISAVRETHTGPTGNDANINNILPASNLITAGTITQDEQNTNNGNNNDADELPDVLISSIPPAPIIGNDI